MLDIFTSSTRICCHSCGLYQPSRGTKSWAGPKRRGLYCILGRTLHSGPNHHAYPRCGKLEGGGREWSLDLAVFQTPWCRWGTPDMDILVQGSTANWTVLLPRLGLLWTFWDKCFDFMGSVQRSPLKLLHLLCRIKMVDIPVLFLAWNWSRRIWHLDIVKLLADSMWVLLDILSQRPV